MEKQSMGSFIAALRKSKGMTQKDLAELLHVSDKAISRWERDETLPDLMLIPIIADIFSVTADELIRGAKKKEGDETSTKSDAEPELSKQTIKRLNTHLKKGLKDYTSKSLISVGLCIFGILLFFILGLLLNYTEGYTIGFFVGLIFIITGIICQIVFTTQLTSLFDTDDIDQEISLNFNRQVFNRASTFFGIILTLTICSITMVSAYAIGVNPIFYGIISIAFSSFILLVSRCIIVNNTKKIRFTQNDFFNAKLLSKCIISFIAISIIPVFLIISIASNTYWFSKGQTCNSMQELQQFVDATINGKNIQANEYTDQDTWPTVIVDTEPHPVEPTNPSDLDNKYANNTDSSTVSYSDEEGFIFPIEFEDRLTFIRHKGENGEIFPITIYLDYHFQQARHIIDVLTQCLIILLVLNLAAHVFIYIRKRK